MTLLRNANTLVLFLILLALPACGTGTNDDLNDPTSGESAVIKCSDIRDEDGKRLNDWVKNTQARFTGHQQIQFLVIRPDSDVETMNNAIVFFNGTSGIMTDWPLGMIKGDALEESLCDKYTLILFDYPGVGGTTGVSAQDFTFDNISKDVGELITYINDTYGPAADFNPNISVVHPLGWSLGTLSAAKFGTLASANGYGSSDDNHIGNIFLIATKPGGDVSSGGATGDFKTADGHGAACIETLFETLKDATSYTLFVKEASFALTFPYVFSSSNKNQLAYDGDDNNICFVQDIILNLVVRLTDKVLFASIETSCENSSASQHTICSDTWNDYKSNRLTQPYKTDEGIPQTVFIQERNVVDDWNFSYCTKAKSDWKSDDCKTNPNVSPPTGYTRNEKNGGLCDCSATKSNDPSCDSAKCISLSHITGELTVINGKQDLFIQHTYGKAFVEVYESLGVSASLNTYDGDAGHGVMYTDPDWVREIILSKMPD